MSGKERGIKAFKIGLTAVIFVVERYAGLWTKEAGPEWQARAGLSEADYQKTFNDLVKQGYRLTWISAHEAGGAVRYEGIWEKKAGGAWEGGRLLRPVLPRRPDLR